MADIKGIINIANYRINVSQILTGSGRMKLDKKLTDPKMGIGDNLALVLVFFKIFYL